MAHMGTLPSEAANHCRCDLLDPSQKVIYTIPCPVTCFILAMCSYQVPTYMHELNMSLDVQSP